MNYQHVTNILQILQNNPKLFKGKNPHLICGLISSEFKTIKKYLLDENLIIKISDNFVPTKDADKFIENNPLQPWVTTKFPMRPNINLEYLYATELNVLSKSYDQFNDVRYFGATVEPFNAAKIDCFEKGGEQVM